MTDPDDITILPRVKTMSGAHGRVYYFQGNIFRPLDVHGSEAGRVKGAIRRFLKEHRDLVDADRAAPGYRTPAELFDDQMGAVAPFK